MENIDDYPFGIVDIQDVCDYLKEKGLRLVKVSGFESEFLDKEIQNAKRRAMQAEIEAAVSNKQLIKALRQWRTERAKEDVVPVYFIMDNTTLLTIARDAPATMEDLLNIHGFGQTKAEKYGASILEIVARESEVENINSVSESNP